MALTNRTREAIQEQIRASITGLIPSGTLRSVAGQIELPGKATALVGMRRAGKTFFVHQLRAERMAAGRPQFALPSTSFEQERLRALEADDLGHLLGESLRHRGVEPISDVASASRDERLRLEGLFREWLRDGGFPEAQGLDAETRGQLLRDYVDVAILRDVVERHGVTNVVALRWLVRQLLGNAGSLFSVEKFHGALRSQGIAVGKDTVHDLLAHLEDCVLVRTVWMESASERQRMVNPRKAYPDDMGLIPVFDRTGRANLGHAVETAVLIELQRRRREVTYVRTALAFDRRVLRSASSADRDCTEASSAVPFRALSRLSRETTASISDGARYDSRPPLRSHRTQLDRLCAPVSGPTPPAPH